MTSKILWEDILTYIKENEGSLSDKDWGEIRHDVKRLSLKESAKMNLYAAEKFKKEEYIKEVIKEQIAFDSEVNKKLVEEQRKIQIEFIKNSKKN